MRELGVHRIPLLTQRLAWIVVMALVSSALSGCAAGRAYGRGNELAQAGDWDTAVVYYTRALQEDPDRPEYRIALERAMLYASRAHLALARAFEEQGELAGALVEYRKTSEYDPSNSQATAKVGELEATIRDLIEAARPRPPIEQMRAQASQETQPPLLSPTSREPLRLQFTDASLRDILDFIGDATGINVTYDPQFQDRQFTVELDGVTIEEALNQILNANESFYKVLNQRTIIVIPDTPQKRAQYEEQVIRTFYVSHADVDELSQLVGAVIRMPQMAVQPTLVPNATANTITVRATTAVMSIIERMIEANDRPRAELVVDIEILEVNRDRVKRFGLNLTDYALGGIFSPEVAPPNESTSPSGVSSPPPFNLNTISQGVSTVDFYLAVPAAVVQFLETDSETKLIAKPQLRGQEGVTLTLNLGDDIPVPTTTFTAIAAGGVTANPLTSFTYRTVGVNIEMTPRVTYEGDIILELSVENSTLGEDRDLGGGVVAPEFGLRRVTTTLRLRDGESNLLAGLLQEQDRRLLRGFPGTLRLPVLKQLFSNTFENTNQTDIVMLLTPHIVRTHELTQEDLSPIHIGTQRNVGLTGPPPLIAPPPGAAVPEPGVEPAAPPAAPPTAPVPPPATTPVPGVPIPPPEPTPPTPTPPAIPGPPAAAGPAAQIVVTPPGLEFQVAGGPYTVPISIDAASQVSTMTVTVTYNPTVLRVRAVQEGSFMRQGSLEVAFSQQVDPIAGRVDISLTRIADLTGASGSGLLAAILFDAVSPGSATLTASSAALTPAGALVPTQSSPVTITVR